jgi:hypothetical protein
MKRLIVLATVFVGFGLITGSSLIFAQTTFKMAFKFEAAGNKFPAGEYQISQKEEGRINIMRIATGQEVSVSILKKLSPPDPPIEAPQLIFDMVANFAPSYTEYVTDYLLAEVWLTENEGYLILKGERAEYTQAVKGVK